MIGTRGHTGPADTDSLAVLDQTSTRRLIAFYLGARTVVVGRRGITVHEYTRGTVDRDSALIGCRAQRLR